MSEATGGGEAVQPEVQTIGSDEVATLDAATIEDEIKKAKEAALADAQAAVASAEAKVAKQQAHLAAAQAGLETAKAELSALESGA